MTLTEKILRAHLIEGEYKPGNEIGIRIDHTLTQDATGTLVYLQFEKLRIDRVKAELSVSYVDHNLLQTDFRNADDHAYLHSVAKRFGIYFSRPGNGVSHQVHMERFGVPGKTMLGADSHTVSAGGISMLAIGAGGLDVALAMGGVPYYLTVPRVFGVKLTGKLGPWVSGKDVILEMLRRFSVKGGVGKVVEYYGPGVDALSMSHRQTICNMGAELGATSSIFPSDHHTRNFMVAQGRGDAWKELKADEGAQYDENTEINLCEIEPLIACPHSPDNVKKVSEVEGLPVGQVIVGSSVNSSFRDLMIVVKALENRVIHENVSFEVNPGSRQVLENIAAHGGVLTLLKAGGRIHQSGCLGCIGMGQAPATNTVSLRTFPRNFKGRSGTDNDQVFLCSPETAVAAAIFGKVTDPRKLGNCPEVLEPNEYITDDGNIIKPLSLEDSKNIQLVRGPNIVEINDIAPLQDVLEGEVLIKTGDNISTDDIIPAGNKVLPYRSNIPAISEFVFSRIDSDFSRRAKEKNGGFVVGGNNYGQGSSREHAALAPSYLGVKAKIVKGFARIHRSNLINYGIIPLVFKNPSDFDEIKAGMHLQIVGIRAAIARGDEEITLQVNGKTISVLMKFSSREREILVAGGELNFIRHKLNK
ncbi:MAG: aconitate hydratase [Candidatus Riflebacteria bacterium]|nr:aconitate hydratase [Candidatus Riflebacteria bacterium]